MATRTQLVVFDVDGVIFHSQLLLRVGWRRGPLAYLRGLWNCLYFDRGKISLTDLLHRTYGTLAGETPEQIWAIYQKMRLSRNAAQAVAELRREVHTVIFLSAGVPDFIVEDLKRRLGADEAAGIHLPTESGRLTGAVSGELAHPEGKVAYIERHLARAGLSWRDVAVIGDDANNVPIMERAGLSIGYKATYAVRRKATVLVDKPDLMQVVHILRRPPLSGPMVPPEERHPVPIRPWHQEIRRKLIHGAGAVLPFLLPYLGRRTWFIPAVLITISGLYMLSEYCRLNGLRFPILSAVTHGVLREGEKRRFAFAPLTLVAGILLALEIFRDVRVASACILIVALSDSIGAIVGERWGRLPLPHNRSKTVEGSLAFLVTSLCAGSLFLPARPLLIGALAATVVESFNIKDFDNLLIPLAAGLGIQLAGVP